MERRVINFDCVAYCILYIDLGSENLAIGYFDESFLPKNRTIFVCCKNVSFMSSKFG